MFKWLKRRLAASVDDWQRREIARLQQETMRLKREIEQKTEKPAPFTLEQRRHLAEKAKGIDPETLKQISIIDPAELTNLDHETDAAEHQ